MQIQTSFSRSVFRLQHGRTPLAFTLDTTLCPVYFSHSAQIQIFPYAFLVDTSISGIAVSTSMPCYGGIRHVFRYTIHNFTLIESSRVTFNLCDAGSFPVVFEVVRILKFKIKHLLSFCSPSSPLAPVFVSLCLFSDYLFTACNMMLPSLYKKVMF